MIPGFFGTVQNDVIFLISSIKNKPYEGPQTHAHTHNISLVVERVFGALLMGAAILTSLSGLTLLKASPAGAILILAMSVGAYVVGHDIFRMAMALSDHEKKKGPEARAVGIWLRLINKTPQVDKKEPPFDYTKDTLIPVIWKSRI